MTTEDLSCIAFAGEHRLAVGSRLEVAVAAKAALDRESTVTILVFDAITSQPVEIDLRGSVAEIAARYAETPPPNAPPEPKAPRPRGPGRPKLGVVGREVTLLPRHWKWLAEQPGSASVTLRKLVETARRQCERADTVRRARDATYRFMAALAGNYAGFEEATRALFANNEENFHAHTESWPVDIRDHARHLASSAFAPETTDHA